MLCCLDVCMYDIDKREVEGCFVGMNLVRLVSAGGASAMNQSTKTMSMSYLIFFVFTVSLLHIYQNLVISAITILSINL